MDIGIGLPSTIAGTPGRRIPEWASAAEEAGFSTLGTIDRIVYGNQETVPTLAAAAAVTERIGLASSILITPYRGNGALLAKQLATVDNLSGGRLRAGVAVGSRPDDYESTGTTFAERGRLFDEQLAEMRAVWAGEPRGFAGPIGPPPVQSDGVPLLIGGTAPAAFRRMAEHGVGWISGGGGPAMFAPGAERARAAWEQAGRKGEPELVALAYVALGDGAEDHARQYLGDYYAFLPDYVDMIVGGCLTTPQLVTESLAGYAEAGCTELLLFPCSNDLTQVRLIAEAAGL